MGNAGSMLGNDFWVRSFLPFLEFPELVAYSTVSTLLRTNVFLRATKFRGLIVHLNEQIDVNLCKRFPNRGERLLEVTNKWRNQEYEPMYSCDTSRMLIILNVREYLWEPTYEVFPFSCVFSCEYPGCSFSKATFASMLAHSKFFEQRHLLPGLSRRQRVTKSAVRTTTDSRCSKGGRRNGEWTHTCSPSLPIPGSKRAQANCYIQPARRPWTGWKHGRTATGTQNVRVRDHDRVHIVKTRGCTAMPGSVINVHRLVARWRILSPQQSGGARARVDMPMVIHVSHLRDRE